MISTMHRGLGALFLLIPLAGASAAQELSHTTPEAVGLSAERLSRIDAAFEEYVAKEQLAGAVALVARRGRIAYLKAFGFRDRESAAPMGTDSIFRIASQTKAIVSVGVMLLLEEGRILLSDPLGKHLPEFEKTTVAIRDEKDSGTYEVVPAERAVTVRDLLTHTSGVGYGYGVASDRWKDAGIQGWYFADRSEPIGETVARMASLPFDAHPGERMVYGYSTDILGALIERVSGEPLDEFLEKRILAPLGMKDTCFYLPAEKAGRLATVYSSDAQGVVRAPDEGSSAQGAYVEGPRTSFSGGAGLVSTATDYARFLQMMLNGGQLDGERILSPKSVQLMTATHFPDISPGTGFGLGYYVVDDFGERGAPGSNGEYGWGGAYHSTYWVDPSEELVVVYLTQLIPADLDDHGRLRALVYQSIVEAGPAGND